MPLKGVNDRAKNPLERRSMRTGWTQPEGGHPAYIHEGRIIDVNLRTWTVDVRTQFDQKFFPNVQVASPYMHPNRGEGIYCMPEVNAKCLICIPSDGPPPFVLAFIMPLESTDDPDTEDTDGTSGMGPATFQGGRTRPKPGDLYMKGRDGQFVILHRGGVLQVGSTELAQRLYIPLGNIICDVSQNYEHHNTGGTVNWGISSSSTDENPKTQFFQTFRISANDEKADVRLAVGRVRQPTPEPAGDAGEQSANAAFGLGEGGGNHMVVDLAFAPQGFEAATGSPASAQKVTKFKFQFDATGNVFLRAEGNVNLRVKKKLRLVVDDEVTFSTKKSWRIVADDKVRIEGSKGVDILSSSGPIVINGGDTPVAAVGSVVDVLITLPIPITTSTGPGIIVPGPNARLTGIIANGVSTVLVPKPG